MHIKRFGIVSMLAFAILLVNTAALAMAETTTTTTEYNLPTQVSDLNFSATLTDDQKVKMSWNEYEPEGFNYYKVIRSQDNTDPVYPDDGYIYMGNSGELAYT
ncbi:hypothetical protein GF340_03350, partial [Candidatus Peregrinibacteria bacterium]|nr:hypothetical protein [Candidatus Peregrinibacteria bacterium]